MYKSKLQEMCHKKKLALPKYSCMRDGQEHNPQFKASVVVDGVNFDTETIWKSSKEAYNEAAKFAFLHFTSGSQSVTKEGNEAKKAEPFQKPEVNPGTADEKHGPESVTKEGNVPEKVESNEKPEVNPQASDEKHEWVQEFKKKLEIFAKRNNLGIPIYRCKKEGEPQHPHCFKATVAVGRDSFDSISSYANMEEAEDAAAQAALLSLAINAFQAEFTNSYKNMLQEIAKKEGLLSPTYNTIKAGSNHALKFISMVEFNGETFCGKPANSKKQAEINAAIVAHAAFLKTDVAAKNNSGSTPEQVALPEMSSLSLSQSSGGNLVDMEMKSYLLCNRVKVYTCIPDMGLPEGAILLPIGESKWVVASLEFPDGIAA